MTVPAYSLARAVHVRYSRHALDTMARRGVKHEDVEATLMRPGVAESNEREGRQGWRFHKGPLCVVMSRDGGYVITVLLRSTEQCTDADAARAINPIHGRDGAPFKPYATRLGLAVLLTLPGDVNPARDAPDGPEDGPVKRGIQKGLSAGLLTQIDVQNVAEQEYRHHRRDISDYLPRAPSPLAGSPTAARPQFCPHPISMHILHIEPKEATA